VAARATIFSMAGSLHKIIVGVDGSDASKAALIWAAHEARPVVAAL
jgi:nucleotide-binding universal stress UspA family protein